MLHISLFDSNDFDWMQQTSRDITNHRSLTTENKWEQAGCVCVYGKHNNCQSARKVKHVLITTGDFHSDQTKENQVLLHTHTLALSISELS